MYFLFPGEQTPKSLDGLFVYEDEAPRVTALKNRGNDAIIVEQWTVFEVIIHMYSLC